MATVYEGTILTVDKDDSVVRYLVEEKGLISYAGDFLPEEFRGCERVQLGDGVLVPAFVDTHMHLASYATFNAGLNVMGAESVVQMMDDLARFAKETRRDTVIAFGASEHSVSEGRLPTREELDRACPDKPVMLVKYDGHALIANSKLVEAAGDSARGLRGYNAQTGLMEQEAFFAVSSCVTGSISPVELVGDVQRAVDLLASRGFGLVNSASGVGFKWNLDISLERWIAKTCQNGFQIRVWPQSFRPGVALKSRIPRIGGCFECALDGSFGSKDAALLEPYADDPQSKGVLFRTYEEVEEFCYQAHNHKLQVALHAIGDAAFDQVTRALARTIDRSFKEVHRHGVIHACLPTEEGLETCAKYGFHLLMQPAFVDWDQEPQDYLRRILGEHRAMQLNPLRTIWDKGIRISAGSDAPCTDPDPIRWMHCACNHPVPGQSLTPKEALRMCTYNGAWVTYDDDEYGSLEKGKAANFVRLSANPYEVPVSELGSIRVEQTILRGKPYRPQSQGFASVVAKGLCCYGYC